MLSWLNNRTIQTKLTGTFMLIFVVGIFTITWNIINIRSINGDTQDVQHAAKESHDLASTKGHLLLQELITRDVILDFSSISTQKDLQASIEDSEKSLDMILESADNDQERANIKQIVDNKKRYEQTTRDIIAANGTLSWPEPMHQQLEDATNILIDAQNILGKMAKTRQDSMLTIIEKSNRNVQYALFISTMGILFFIMMSVVVTLITRQIARPIKCVTAAAAAVKAGTFKPHDLDPIAGRQDELGQLARVFQHMAHEVYAREERLKQQMQQLRIEVDQNKRAQQVSAIVESDYFRELQAKAKLLRHRSARINEADATE